MAYKVGESVICSIEVKTAAGVLTSPATSMNVKIDELSPTSISKVASTAMTLDSTGKYHYDCQTAGYDAGQYRVTYTATDGSRISIQTDTFILE